MTASGWRQAAREARTAEAARGSGAGATLT